MPGPSLGRLTARELLASVRPFGPAADVDELVFAADPPPDLLGPLRVLHTGVRAALAGRPWYGCDGVTGRAGELSPAAPIPDGVALLRVAGDRRWDRIDPTARAELPHLFEPPPGGR